MRSAVQRIYRERKSLTASLADMSSAISKLDGVLLGVGVIIFIFAAMLIFNRSSTVASLVPLSTIVYVSSFLRSFFLELACGTVGRGSVDASLTFPLFLFAMQARFLFHLRQQCQDSVRESNFHLRYSVSRLLLNFPPSTRNGFSRADSTLPLRVQNSAFDVGDLVLIDEDWLFVKEYVPLPTFTPRYPLLGSAARPQARHDENHPSRRH